MTSFVFTDEQLRERTRFAFCGGLLAGVALLGEPMTLRLLIALAAVAVGIRLVGRVNDVCSHRHARLRGGLLRWLSLRRRGLGDLCSGYDHHGICRG